MADWDTKRSPIWKYFEVCGDDDLKAVGKTCNDKVSRGGSVRKSYNTTNLRKHLEQRHKDKHKELMELEERERSRKRLREEESNTVQPKIDETLCALNPYSWTSQRHVTITQAVGRMIATDFQPFSIVEDEGFQLLLRVLDRRYQLPSRKHFSEHVIPKMYTELKEKVSTVIKSAKTLALTTDCWTSRSTDSYISITSHFIDDKFKRQLVVLDTFPMCERHTAQNLLSKILSILEAWMIDKKRVTCFVRDNAANITAAVRDGGFVHIGCIDNTLQLAINDGLDDDVVAGILKSVKSIVSHFHRSTSSRQLLSNAQTQLQLPVHQLCQEVSTRWNSTFYMLERISEQRRAITSVLPDTTCSTELTIIQWNIIQQLILLLRPFEQFSREFERADASISLVIPGIRMLCKHLSKPVTDDENRSVRNVREGVASSLQTRFSGIELWELHSVATLLDPRFKVKGFSSASFAELAKSKVLEKAKEMADPARGNPEDNESVEEYHTRNKKSKESSLWEEFDVDKDDSDQPILSGEEKELEQYLSIPRLPHVDDPLNFWRIHEYVFPTIHNLRKQSLGFHLPQQSLNVSSVVQVTL